MRVPRYDGPQVESRNLPGVNYSDGGIDAEAMGAGIGRAGARLGAVIGKIAEAQQEKVNDATLMKFKNTLAQNESELMYDPKNGAYAKKGSESFTLMDTVLPEWQKREAAAVDALPRHLREQGSALAAQTRTNIDSGLKRHILQETDKYGQEQADGVVANSTNIMSLNYKDPDRLAEEAGNITAAVALKLRGASPELIKSATDEAVSKGYMGVVTRALQDDPDSGEQLLETYGANLTAPDYAKVNDVVRAGVQDREDEAEVQAVVNGSAVGREVWDAGEAQQHKADTTLEAVPLSQRKQLKYDAPELNAYAAHTEQKYNLPAGILNALKNSGEKSNSWQSSPKGAAGCMQFMPATAKRFGVSDRTDPVQCIDAAGQYMKYLMKFFKGDVTKAVAAYNAGEGNVKKHGGIPPFKETREYVERVMGSMGKPRSADVAVRDTPVGPTRKPQNEAEAMQIAEELYADNPRKRARIQQGIRRVYALKDMQERQDDKDNSESLYTKIYAATTPTEIEKLMTPAEREWAIKSGKMDAFQSALDRKFKGDEDSDVSPDSQMALDNIVHQAAMGKPGAADYLKKLNPYDPTLKITRSDRARIAGAQESFFSSDVKKANEAKADAVTEADRLSTGLRSLGLSDVGEGKKDKAKKEMVGQFRLAYQQARVAAVQANGKLSPEQEDAVLRGTVTRFTRARAAGDTSRYGAMNRVSQGLDVNVKGGRAALSESDRKFVRDSLTVKLGRTPTEAEIIYAASPYLTPDAN